MVGSALTAMIIKRATIKRVSDLSQKGRIVTSAESMLSRIWSRAGMATAIERLTETPTHCIPYRSS
jgi:hypothetical protein